MWNALTRSRTPDYHRATMIKVLIAGVLLYALWEPIRPLRQITADALYTTADLISQ